MWMFWLIATGIFFVGEMATTGFLIFWLGIGIMIGCMLETLFIKILVISIFFTLSYFLFCCKKK